MNYLEIPDIGYSILRFMKPLDLFNLSKTNTKCLMTVGYYLNLIKTIKKNQEQVKRTDSEIGDILLLKDSLDNRRISTCVKDTKDGCIIPSQESCCCVFVPICKVNDTLLTEKYYGWIVSGYKLPTINKVFVPYPIWLSKETLKGMIIKAIPTQI